MARICSKNKNRYTGEICTSYSKNNISSYTGDSLHQCYCYANWDPILNIKNGNIYPFRPLKFNTFLNGQTINGNLSYINWKNPTDYDFLKHTLSVSILSDYALDGLGLSTIKKSDLIGLSNQISASNDITSTSIISKITSYHNKFYNYLTNTLNADPSDEKYIILKLSTSMPLSPINTNDKAKQLTGFINELLDHLSSIASANYKLPKNSKYRTGILSAPVCGSFENNSNKWKYYACLKHRNIDEKNKRNFFKDKDIPEKTKILDHIQVNRLKSFIDSEIANRKQNNIYKDLQQQSIKNQNVGDLVDSKYPQKILDAANAIHDKAQSLDSDDTIYKNTEDNIKIGNDNRIISGDITKAKEESTETTEEQESIETTEEQESTETTEEHEINKLFEVLSNIYKDCICYSDCGQYAEKVCKNYGSCGCNYY